MKRFFSIFFAFLISVSAFSLSVFAAEPKELYFPTFNIASSAYGDFTPAPFDPADSSCDVFCYFEFTYEGKQFKSEEFLLRFVEDGEYGLDMPYTFRSDLLTAYSSDGDFIAGRFFAWSGTYNDTLYIDVCFEELISNNSYKKIKPDSLTMYVVDPNAEPPTEPETTGNTGNTDNSDNSASGDSSNDTPMKTVSYALRAAISWVGSIVHELMYGELSGLLSLVAVAISISALLLVCRLIKKFGWGM